MNQVKESSNTRHETLSNQRLHLAYLDGIRGLASLYVVLVHCWDVNVAEALQPALLWLPLAKFLRYGIFAVVVFIVLSGYCLMLPVVRSNKGYLSGGLLGFFKRRIRRILPPYYAAMIFCVLVGGLILWLDRTAIFQWNDERVNALNGLFSPVFYFRDVLAYFILIQNFGLHLNEINGPTWTVAVEWQIYFIFAVFLIPIWRRFGIFITVIIAFSLGLTLTYLLGEDVASNICPWFLGLFALGMASAEISFSQKTSFKQLKNSLSWGVLAAVFAGVAFLIEWLRFSLLKELPEWIVHYGIALATACLLIYCTNFSIKAKALPPILRLLESRSLVALGIFSYSLYITHAPIVWLVHQFLISQKLSPSVVAAKWLLIAVPLSLVFGYLFHRVFERPFMSQFSSNLKSKKREGISLAKSYKSQDLVFRGEKPIRIENECSTSLSKLLEWLRDYLSVDTVTLLLPVIDQQNLTVYATIGLEEEIVQQIHIPVGQGFAGHIAASMQPMIVDNLSMLEVVSPILRDKGLRSLLGIPLPIKQSMTGVLHIGKLQFHHFTERDVQQLELAANLIKSVIADTGHFNFK
ncbi:acyltransferase family protein [Nostoc sp. UHCC 0302]|uniref:acyltransferase family protein n=1 Tax=Nostoc sp. UHCC 0302 TaxID=3134896 RepID=UPI00311CD1D9